MTHEVQLLSAWRRAIARTDRVAADVFGGPDVALEDMATLRAAERDERESGRAFLLALDLFGEEMTT